MGAANLFLSIGVYSYRISNIDSYAILLNFWHLGYALHKRKEILLMKMKRILSLLLSILITVSLAAATAPAALAECMYEPEIFGRSDGYLFIIE